jgi:predicted aldo/keto reductase-like oxidoreductase
MRYRRFGKTELQIPVISCGGMRFQFKWQDVDPLEVPPDNQANLEAVIERAYELGINHFETARGYGSSEMQLGPVLSRLPREKIIVQTKVSPRESVQEFLKTFDQSLRYLRVPYVDLLALHGINNRQLLDYSLRPGGCLDAARKLQREGRARFIGFSTHATTDIILDTIRTGDFDFVNLHWYFVNELTWPAIEAAHAKDMGVFIISPNDKGGKLYEPPKKLLDLCSPLTPMQFNDLFCLARPEVHTLSCGAARPEDFDEHVRALEHYDTSAEVIAPIESRLRAEMDRVLGRDWTQHWWEGLPDYLQVPGELNVTEILRLWTYAQSLDISGWAKMRYNLLGQGDHWFPGENAGSVDKRKLSGCLSNSRFEARIPEILQEAHRLYFEKPARRISAS